MRIPRPPAGAGKTATDPPVAGAGPSFHSTDLIEPPPGIRYVRQLWYDIPFANDVGGEGSSQRWKVPRMVMLFCSWPRSSLAVKVRAGSLSLGGAALPSAVRRTRT